MKNICDYSEFNQLIGGKPMEKEELIELFEQFLNDNGKYCAFKVWLDCRGYTLQELGFKEYDEIEEENQ